MQVSFKNSLSTNQKSIAFKANPGRFASFQVKNPESWQELQDCYMKNKNGLKVLRFAASWAHKIEGAVKQGVKFDDAFNKARLVTLERNKISKPAQVWAKSILEKVWNLGKQLELKEI